MHDVGSSNMLNAVAVRDAVVVLQMMEVVMIDDRQRGGR